MSTTYKAQQFNLSSLKGISDETLEMHFKLYEGYVKETNNLNEKIAEFIKDGQSRSGRDAAYSELTRRLGFEYNGMVLHEYYFENLKSGGGTGDPDRQDGIPQGGGRVFRQLRHLESRFRRASARCAAWAGPSVTRIRRTAAIESLDHAA